MVLLLIGVSGFAFWAFSERQTYKNDVDKLIEKQVSIAKIQTETAKDNEFAEKEKQPLKSYQGPTSYGSVSVKYPKTWSGYVDDTGKGNAPVDGYFYPTTVPGLQSGAAYALRVQVLERSFSEEARSYDSQVKSGKARSSSYSSPNVEGVVGMRIEGEVASKKQGIVVLLPLRDKTIKLYTESDQYYNDFNNNILPNFKFTP